MKSASSAERYDALTSDLIIQGDLIAILYADRNPAVVENKDP
jgi:hypothetical protein